MVGELIEAVGGALLQLLVGVGGGAGGPELAQIRVRSVGGAVHHAQVVEQPFQVGGAAFVFGGFAAAVLFNTIHGGVHQGDLRLIPPLNILSVDAVELLHLRENVLISRVPLIGLVAEVHLCNVQLTGLQRRRFMGQGCPALSAASISRRRSRESASSERRRARVSGVNCRRSASG